MEIKVGYGNGTQSFQIDDANLLGIVEPPSAIEHCNDERKEIRRSLDCPIGSPRLSDIVNPGETIAILTSDITRPFPTSKVLPCVIEELIEAGIRSVDITVVFCLGSHRQHTEDEKKRLIGESLFNRINCKDSSEGPYVNLGITSRGTPIAIMELVVKADRRICLGNVEYHYFAGYSGGYKAIMPGASTYSAIEMNHALMVDDNARASVLSGNPVREDIEEAGKFVGADFIVNVVLDEGKRILRSFAGDAIAAHRAACDYLDSVFRISIANQPDIIVASQGGLPKDINLYQLQKALDNAYLVIREGGVIILTGCCIEGFGNETFQTWMQTAKTPADLITRLADCFKLGGHKAAAIAKVCNRASIYLVSEIPIDQVPLCCFTPFQDVQSALDAALTHLGPDSNILVMPHAGSTMPYIAL